MRRRSPVRPIHNGWLRPIATGVIAGALAASLFGWFVVRPRMRANDEAEAALALIRADNDRTEQLLSDYDAFKRDAEDTERRFSQAIAAVPTEAELAGALQDLEGVTRDAGVSLVRFAPAALRDNGSSRNTPVAPKPGVPAQPQPSINARQIAVVVRCGFGDYQSLLGRLASFPRLLTVEGFRMRSANRDGFTIEASLTLNCYYKQAPPIATVVTPVASR